MAAPIKLGKLSKLEKKVIKKQRQAQATLYKHDKIRTVDYTTHHIVVANGGLGNDVTLNELHRIFQTCGDVLDIVMQPNKPYSFVSYVNLKSVTSALKTIHGRSHNIDGRYVFFYLNCVEQVPGVEIPNPNSELPPGLILLEDYVSLNSEQLLKDCIKWEDTDENASRDGRQSLKHRKVKHYGYEFLYGTNNVNLDQPLKCGIPSECDSLIDRLLSDGYLTTKPDQLTVNKYEPGQGIPPHVDTPSAFEDRLVSVSLGSQVVMEFGHPDGRTVPVLLPARSVLVMTGESRYVWSHAIVPRKSDILPISAVKLINYNNKVDQSEMITSATKQVQNVSLGDHPTTSEQIDTSEQNMADNVLCSKRDDRLTLLKRGVRTSLTFRKTLADPDNYAPLQEFTTSSKKLRRDDNGQVKKSILKTPTTQEDAQNVERTHVRKVYDQIAGHFSNTRHTMWPQVAEFLRDLPDYSIVADVGCGNGKYLQGDRFRLIKMGCDRSFKLCDICSDGGFPVFVCDALQVPLRSECFDACISIAVIHHMSTEGRRQQAIDELIRILKPGAKGLIYVWALEQERNNEKSNYLKTAKGTGCPVGGNYTCTNVETKDTSSTEPEESLPVHVNRTQFKAQDLLVPWHLRKKDENTGHSNEGNSSADNFDQTSSPFLRYYHVFVEGELENLLKRSQHSKLVQVVKSYYDKGNWCLIFEKIYA